MSDDGIKKAEGRTSAEASSAAARAVRQGPTPEMQAEQQELRNRMSRIGRKILVMSGKGGVGKSTVAVNLAVSLARSGQRVGLLDVDVHGPSIPKMLNLEDRSVVSSGQAMVPVSLGNMKVMSLGFLLAGREEAVIWRGPLKMALIRQFLKDVEWGDLDYLIIDAPPGTGDEPLSVCQLIENVDGAVVVTTPQEVATADVRRSVAFCRKLNLPVLGIIENMSGFVCPKCGEVTEIFRTGGGEKLSDEMGIPFLGKIPIDPDIARFGDQGVPYLQRFAGTETARAFGRAIRLILFPVSDEQDSGQSHAVTGEKKT